VIGVLPLDKPVGPTSHDMVARVRRALGTRRVGHAGTLDPFASGLLLVAVGEATRLVEYLHHLDKSYEAEARLGEVTATDDPEGEVVARSAAWEGLEAPAIAAALSRQVGTFLQRPPSYSAKKIEGEAAYRLARRGDARELAPVEVTVHEVELLAVELPMVRFRVRCGTGTYIRAMARDLGEALGCGAHLTALRRTRIGPHEVSEALGPDDLDNRERVDAKLLDPARAVGHLPAVQVDAATEARLRMGQRVPCDASATDPSQGEAATVALLGPGGLIGVGERVDGVLRPRKILPGSGSADA
jgi:tRNA pseudouridine55 synthase